MSSIFANVFAPQQRAAVPKDLTLQQVNTGLFGLPLIFGNTSTLATHSTALTLSAYYAAVNILSDDIAKLPKSVFKKQGQNREKFTEHPINYLLSVRPNSKMTPFSFWKTVELLRIHKGNAYARIVRNENTGEALEWVLLENKYMKVLETSENLYYNYKDEIIDSADILHFKGFSLDGKVGVGVVYYAAHQMGISLEAQKYGTTIYENRGVSYGVIESDHEVKNENKKMISEGFTAKLSERNPHKAPVLDEGLKYKSISITPAEAQFLETNKNGIIEVCRWLNIAPHKLKDLSSANYSNIYQQSIEHVQDSVLPRVMAAEEELNFKCFTREEQKTLYTKFNIAVLLRGDLQAKSTFYTAMVYAGIYTRNEVRALEDMNPVDGLDEILQPVNMQGVTIANELLKNTNNGTDN